MGKEIAQSKQKSKSDGALTPREDRLKTLADSLPRAVFTQDLPEGLRPTVIIHPTHHKLIPPVFRGVAIPVLVVVPQVDGSVLFVVDSSPPFAVHERYCHVAPPECAPAAPLALPPPTGEWCTHYGEVKESTPRYDFRPFIPWALGATEAEKELLRLRYSRALWWSRSARERESELIAKDYVRAFSSLCFDAPRLRNGDGNTNGELGPYNPNQLAVFPTHVTKDEEGETVYLHQSLFSAAVRESKGWDQQTDEERKNGAPTDVFFQGGPTPAPKDLDSGEPWHRSRVHYDDGYKTVRSATNGVFFFAADTYYHNSSWLAAMRPLAVTQVPGREEWPVHRDIAGDIAAAVSQVRARLKEHGLDPSRVADLIPASKREEGGWLPGEIIGSQSEPTSNVVPLALPPKKKPRRR